MAKELWDLQGQQGFGDNIGKSEQQSVEAFFLLGNIGLYGFVSGFLIVFEASQPKN